MALGPLLLLIVACGSPRTETAPGPETPARTVAPVAVPVPADDRDPRIVAAQAKVRRETIETDIGVLEGPRTPFGAPAALATAAAYIEAQLLRAGFRVTRQSVSHHGATADNVIAERVGRDPSKVVVVGAHYDTVPGAPGADDNASGIAAMLAIARAAGSVPTRATLRMVAFAFEEDGLMGSMRWVESLDAAETGKISLAIVFDMVAYRSDEPGSQRFPPGMQLLAPGRQLPTVGDFIGVVGLTDLPAPAAEALAASRAYAGGLKIESLSVPPEVVLMAPDLLRGDHASMWLAEIPAIAVGDTGDYRNPHYHLPSDTMATLDLDFATDVARWSTAVTLLAAGVAE